MTRGWKQCLSVLTALALLIGLLPMSGLDSAMADGEVYGKTTVGGVFLRKGPATGDEYWFKVDIDTVAQVLGTVVKNGITWYKVQMTKPGSQASNTYIGYFHGSYFRMLNEAETASWLANPINYVTTPEGQGATSSTEQNSRGTARGRVNAGGVNMREGPSLKKPYIVRLERNTVVELLSLPSASDTDPWYKVQYDGYIGYIQGRFITVISTGNLAVVTAVPSVTGVPSVVTTAPAYSGSYVKLLLSSANLREVPAGTVLEQWEETGSTLPIIGTPTVVKNYTWYQVMYHGRYYWVRSDCVQVTNTPSGGSEDLSGATATPSATAPGTVTAAPATAAPAAYIKVTKDEVALRLQPAEEVITRVPKNTVLAYTDYRASVKGFNWYYVNYEGVKGWLRSDCVQESDGKGAVATPVPATAAPATAAPATAAPATAAPATAAPAVDYGTVTTTVDKVNVRKQPAEETIDQIASKGTTLKVNAAPVDAKRYTWYYITSPKGVAGWIRSDCVKVNAPEPVPTTPGPAETETAPATATPAPTDEKTPQGDTVYGYVYVTKTEVALRTAPGESIINRVDLGTVWPMISATVTKSGYDWYHVRALGVKGYLRSDCAYIMTAEQVAQWKAGQGVGPTAKPTTAPTAKPGTAAYVQTVLSGVNIRAAASTDARSLGQVNKGTVLICSGVLTSGGKTWYNVAYDGRSAYVLGSCVKTMTEAEYQAYLNNLPSGTTPNPIGNSGYVKTIKAGVNVRSTPGGDRVLGQIPRNQLLSFSAYVTSGTYGWYYVRTAYGQGWVRSDCVEVTDSSGSTTTPAPTATSAGRKPEASYTTLRLGSTGAQVTKLVEELKKQGYYKGADTDTYTSEVQAAVTAFQSDKGLAVDGVAGSQTQHALFNTVPVGTYTDPGVNPGDLTMVIYPAEKIDWFNGGIQEMFPRGASAKIYDVKTGIVWWAYRSAGAYHADIEPLTAADTARLCSIYGVSTAAQIASKNLYQRRPCLITIGNRTFACALYGIPHNENGDTIEGNNMTGQICLHFTNSKTHGTKVVYYLNTEAIEYAWLNAPNGHK